VSANQTTAWARGRPPCGRKWAARQRQTRAPVCSADMRSAGCGGGLAALPRPSQWAEEWADGWSACEGEGKGGVKGLSSRAEVREKVRGEYRFISLEAKKKGKFYFVIYIAGFFFKKFFRYEVIVK
jgi:hypothetical protein